MKGYAGSILLVDLDRLKVSRRELGEDLAKRFLGGRGINVRLLVEFIGKGVDPLSPKNVLIFGTGPFVGTPIFGASRFNVTARSPLTGYLADSNCGGFFGVKMKQAGFDHVVVLGRAREPVYLLLDDGDAKIVKAGDLWGKDTLETQRVLKERHGEDYEIACIGPAGENLVRFACVINGLGRAAGRTGLGAVMGSKNLKAIVAGGSMDVEIHEPEKLLQFLESKLEELLENPLYETYSRYGTSYLLEYMAKAGMLPVENFRRTTFENLDRISPDRFLEKVVKSSACFSCPIGCGHYNLLGDEGPEYEGLAGFGPRVLNSDLDSILRANMICNRMGMDVISAASAIAVAMELSERGMLDARIDWGDPDVILRLLEMIAKRKGIGDALAEGSLRFARRFGEEALRFVVHAKGLEIEATELRGYKGCALNHMVSTRGGDHLRGFPTFEHRGKHMRDMPEFPPGASDPSSYDGKAQMVIWYENFDAVIDSLEMCKFVTPMGLSVFTIDEVASMFEMVTGFDTSSEDLMRCGERIYNLERAYICSEGVRREHDLPPPRLVEEPIPDGPRAGERLEVLKFEKMLVEYYRLRGWNYDGVPTREKLVELGLDFMLKRL